MTLIRIQERQADPGGPNAILSFDHGAEYPIMIRDPLSDEQEQCLEWYFEEWLGFPLLDQVKADAAAQSITSYGENLFRQVFADPEAFASYRAAAQVGIGNLQIEIAGSPGFHRWHWEALKDPKLPQPFCLQATMVRRNVKPQVIQAMSPVSPTINLLIVAARPEGAYDVGYRTISRPLVEMMRNAKLPVQIDIVRPGTYRALLDHLENTRSRHPEGYYHVIHFDVHGALLSYEEYQLLRSQHQGERMMEAPYGRNILDQYEGQKAFLFLQGEQGESSADPVEASQLADLLLNYRIPITILNACQSGKQVGASETSLGSRLMQAGVQLVLAMGYSVTVSAAKLLMSALYQQLFQGQDFSTAIRRGRQELYNNKEREAYFDQTIDLEDWILPVVYQNQPQRLQTRDFTGDESAAFYGRQASRYQPSKKPGYGFEGRDVDILELERVLLTKHNLVLVQGMGGAGKTTLLQYLGSWWQTTGLVDQVFYFGYDEKAWTRQQILHIIARQLLGEINYLRDFQPLSPDAQQAMLGQRLRSERHLLLLDNLESITGAQLAIQHTLPPEERNVLKGLLADLVGGQTLVLLGSRGSEPWLAKGTFVENVYELVGLDPEAASSLADRILERHKATNYLQDPEYYKILKLLNGFPLALEVVLANLATQTPSEVLSALQAGDISLDRDTQDKTKSIMCCIDYSHSNLAPELQQLLLCLAPFTSVFFQNNLELYTTYLRQQPVLAGLPFERWPEVILEAINWGLLSPDPDIPALLRLQPTLPYFLRHRLQEPDHMDARSAIESAFLHLYDQIGNEQYRLLQSTDPQERQKGQISTGLEYENLMTSLNNALSAQVSIIMPYNALSEYLDVVQDWLSGLNLSQIVIDGLRAYPPDKRTGRIVEEIVRVLYTLATQYLKLKRYPEAEAAFQKSLKLVSELEQFNEKERVKFKAPVYHALGNVFEEQRQFEQAGQYYHQALQIYIELKDRRSQACTYHQLGRVAHEQRQFETAEQYYHQALQIKIDLNDSYAQASTYHNLGSVAKEQKQFEQAEQYYRQALQIAIDFNDRYSQASTYHELGRVAHEQRQFEQAEQYYRQALEIKIDLNDSYSQGCTYHQLGKVAEEQRQFVQAEQYYRQALKIAIDFNDRYSQASTYHQLGRVAEEQYDWGKARGHFLSALEIFVFFHDAHGIGIVLRSLARLWRASGDTSIPAAVFSILGTTLADTETFLSKNLPDDARKVNGV